MDFSSRRLDEEKRLTKMLKVVRLALIISLQLRLQDGALFLEEGVHRLGARLVLLC